MSRTGRIWPVRLVMCVTSMTRVLRRDRLAEGVHHGGGGGRRHGEADLLDDDALAPGALRPGRDHARIVLVRLDDLVAGLQVDAEDQVLERLGRVARDRHLLGVAAELGRELAPAGLDARLEDRPHLVDGDLVGEAHVADHLVEHVGGRRAAAAVVQVDQRAVDLERLLDRRPVALVHRERGRLLPRGGLSRVGDSRHGVSTECGQCGNPGQSPEKGPAIETHVVLRESCRNPIAVRARPRPVISRAPRWSLT